MQNSEIFSEFVILRISPSAKEIVERVSRAQGMSTSAFARQALLDRAVKLLNTSKKTDKAKG
jgi:hypothetical protein